MAECRRTPGAQRVYAKLRTILIGYGVGAYALFGLGPWSQATQPAGSFAASQSYLLAGVGVQVALLVAHALIRRRVADPDSATRITLIVELLGDGATVLLFALATLGVLTRAADTF